MATKTFVNIAGDTMKSTIQVQSPSTTLYTILAEFCKQWNVNQDNYALSYKKKQLDLSLPWRLTGLANNCTLDLERAKSTKKGGVGTVSLAIQIDQKRLVGSYPLKMTVWDVLLTCEKTNTINVTRLSKQDKKTKKDLYQQITVSIMNNALKTLDVLQTKTLAELGLRNGDNVLARVTYENSDKTLAEMLPILDQYKLKSEEEFVTSTPTPKTAPSSVAAAADAFPVEQAQQAKQPQADADNSNNAMDIVSDQQQEQQQQSKAEPSSSSSSASFLPIEDDNAKEVKLYKLANIQFDKSEILSIPEADFELTANELRSLLATQDKKKSDDMLKTQKMRDAADQKKKRVYAKCLVRFRYPSGLIVQASFKPNATIAQLHSFVGKTIESVEQCPYYMYVAPPVKRLDDEMAKTLSDLDFVPAVIINIALDKKKAAANSVEPIIKSEFMPLLQDVEKEKLPEAVGSAKQVQQAEANALAVAAAKKDFSQKVLGDVSSSASEEKQNQDGKSGNKPASGAAPKWFRKQ